MGYTRITADTLISRDRCKLHGLIIYTSADGGDVTLYEAQDALTGREIFTFTACACGSNPLMFPEPIELDALYADVGAYINEVLILWSPLD